MGQKLILRSLQLLMIISAVFHAHTLFSFPGLEVLDDNDSVEVLALTLIVLFAPLLILYINLKDYFNARSKGEVLRFWKSFGKQMLGMFVYLLVTSIVIWVSEIGKGISWSHTIFLPFFATIGLVLSLIVTPITRSLSKRNLNMMK